MGPRTLKSYLGDAVIFAATLWRAIRTGLACDGSLTLFRFARAEGGQMIVMKFGGTSVEDATAIRRLVSIVRRQSHRRPVVVVSAMSRTTNGLLECARMAAAGEIGPAQSRLDEISAHHFKTAEQLAPPQEIESLRETLSKR